MNRPIIVIGQGPLPPELAEAGEGEQRLSAPGIRAWHFARALREAGHAVALVSVMPQPLIAALPRHLEPDFTLYSLAEADVTGGAALARLEQEFEPEAVVAASVWPSYLASLYFSPQLPLWADLFGSPLAEGQAKAVQAGDDAVLEPFARFERTVLRRADRVSAVSSYQEYATVGALATHGRLNRASDGYRLVYTIPATLDPAVEEASAQPFLRGPVVPPEAFVVLWSGGFNTWTDIDTLFRGLEGAMQRCHDLHFVSTGGALPPHDSQTYPRFQQLTAASPNCDRYHLLGWRPYSGLHNYYLESNLGLVLDRWSYEGVLGSRTRLLDWLLYGLPAVTTVTAELTVDLVREGLAWSFPHGDGPALATLLTGLAADRAGLGRHRQRGSQYVRDRFAYSRACEPLLEWAAAPRRAPDADLPLPVLNEASAPALERLLADHRSQLEAKNLQIKALETWAGEMEARLKARPKGRLASGLTKNWPGKKKQ